MFLPSPSPQPCSCPSYVTLKTSTAGGAAGRQPAQLHHRPDPMLGTLLLMSLTPIYSRPTPYPLKAPGHSGKRKLFFFKVKINKVKSNQISRCVSWELQLVGFLLLWSKHDPATPELTHLRFYFKSPLNLFFLLIHSWVGSAPTWLDYYNLELFFHSSAQCLLFGSWGGKCIGKSWGMR